MSKPKKPRKVSGDPRKAAAAKAAAAVVTNPCLHCETRQRSRGGLWCLTCSASHHRRGQRNKPSADMVRRTLLGLAVAFDLADPSVVEFPPPIDPWADAA